jgi:hypothetical protein
MTRDPKYVICRPCAVAAGRELPCPPRPCGDYVPLPEHHHEVICAGCGFGEREHKEGLRG